MSEIKTNNQIDKLISIDNTLNLGNPKQEESVIAHINPSNSDKKKRFN